jgi:hypothetical protein
MIYRFQSLPIGLSYWICTLEQQGNQIGRPDDEWQFCKSDREAIGFTMVYTSSG